MDYAARGDQRDPRDVTYSYGIGAVNPNAIVKSCHEYKPYNRDQMQGVIMTRLEKHLRHYLPELTKLFNSYLKELNFDQLSALNSQFDSSFDLLNYIGSKLETEKNTN